VEEVELLERFLVALLRALDQRANLRGLGRQATPWNRSRCASRANCA
jgi:hypothetical protein